MKQTCVMYVETQERECVCAFFFCIMYMYSQHVYTFGINVVFLCMLIRLVDTLESSCISITMLPICSTANSVLNCKG